MSNSDDVLFAKIHKEQYSMVLQMCLGYSKGDPDIAKDICQETFINVWKGLKNFKGQSQYKTWIYRITVNTCLQYIRKAKKVTKVSINEATLSKAEDSQNRRNNQYSELYSAIGKLEEFERLLIMMVLDGQEYQVISEVTGLQPTNVRVKIHRIKTKLKKILENENG